MSYKNTRLMQCVTVAVVLAALVGPAMPSPREAMLTAQAAQSNQSSLLVLNKADNTLAIINPANLEVLARVPTGEGPHEVTTSADGRLAFVANYGVQQKPGNSISVIDLAARKEIRRVDLGPLMRPHGIVERGGKIYFTVEVNRAIARYDPAADRVDWVMGTGQTGTHMLVVTPDQKRIYTANIGSDTVTLFEMAAPPAQSRVTHIPVGKMPEALDLSPDSGELWVGSNNEGTVSIINTSGNAVKETIKVGQMPIRIKFTPDGRRVLVSDPPRGELIVFEAATRKEIKRIEVGGAPVGILIAPDNRRAFIATTQANKVAVVDLETLAVAGTINTGMGPDGMAWAGK